MTDKEIDSLIARLQHYAYPNKTSFEGTLMEAATVLDELRLENIKLKENLHDYVLLAQKHNAEISKLRKKDD